MMKYYNSDQDERPKDQTNGSECPRKRKEDNPLPSVGPMSYPRRLARSYQKVLIKVVHRQ